MINEVLFMSKSKKKKEKKICMKINSYNWEPSYAFDQQNCTSAAAAGCRIPDSHMLAKFNICDVNSIVTTYTPSSFIQRLIYKTK